MCGLGCPETVIHSKFWSAYTGFFFFIHLCWFWKVSIFYMGESYDDDVKIPDWYWLMQHDTDDGSLVTLL